MEGWKYLHAAADLVRAPVLTEKRICRHRVNMKPKEGEMRIESDRIN